MIALCDSGVCEKKDHFGCSAVNLIHVALAVKHVLPAPAFKILWNFINFLPSQTSILSGK